MGCFMHFLHTLVTSTFAPSSAALRRMPPGKKKRLAEGRRQAHMGCSTHFLHTLVTSTFAPSSAALRRMPPGKKKRLVEGRRQAYMGRFMALLSDQRLLGAGAHTGAAAFGTLQALRLEVGVQMHMAGMAGLWVQWCLGSLVSGAQARTRVLLQLGHCRRCGQRWVWCGARLGLPQLRPTSTHTHTYTHTRTHTHTHAHDLHEQ